MAAKISLDLGNNVKMPVIGLGTWDAKEEKEVEDGLNIALEQGYRHIDTAWFYKNEVTIGKILKIWFDSGKLKREDLFITTKLPFFAVRPDKVEYYMKQSLKNLQLDYVDLYLIHFPVCLDYEEANFQQSFIDPVAKTLPKTDHVGVWKKMEEQVDAGRAKKIGLSNYKIDQIETILKSSRIKPANLQIEVHVYMQQNRLVDFCDKNGITVVAYSPLANPGYNRFLKNLGKEEKVLPNILGDKTIEKIAKKYNKSAAQIALRFLIERNISTIPKSVTEKRIKENISVFDFKLDAGDIKELKALDIGEDARVYDFQLFKGLPNHPDFPFKKQQNFLRS